MQHYSGTLAGSAREFMVKVYGWMAAALAISAGTAYYVAVTPAIQAAIDKPGVSLGLIIGEFALVLFLGFMLKKMNFATAAMAYILYALLSGLTLSSIFLVYKLGSIVTTFIVTAGMFGFMALYGYFTKEDLSSMGSLLMMGLVGLILGGLVNMFWRSPRFSYVLSGIGVVVFAMLSAYDVQRIKQFGQSMLTQGEMAGKVAILGALMLYLDFINLFLYLLRFMGQKKD